MPRKAAITAGVNIKEWAKELKNFREPLKQKNKNNKEVIVSSSSSESLYSCPSDPSINLQAISVLSPSKLNPKIKMSDKISFKNIPKLTSDFSSCTQFFESCKREIRNKPKESIEEILRDILIHCSDNQAFERISEINFTDFNSFKTEIYKKLFPSHNPELLLNALRECKQNSEENIGDFIHKFRVALKKLNSVLPKEIQAQEFNLTQVKKIFIKNLRPEVKILAVPQLSQPLETIFSFLTENADIASDSYDSLEVKINQILTLTKKHFTNTNSQSTQQQQRPYKNYYNNNRNNNRGNNRNNYRGNNYRKNYRGNYRNSFQNNRTPSNNQNTYNRYQNSQAPHNNFGTNVQNQNSRNTYSSNNNRSNRFSRNFQVNQNINKKN